MKILVTGCAGFIGFSLCSSLFSKKVNIIGIDNLNKYYDVKLKLDRLSFLKKIYQRKKIFLNLKRLIFAINQKFTIYLKKKNLTT